MPKVDALTVVNDKLGSDEGEQMYQPRLHATKQVLHTHTHTHRQTDRQTDRTDRLTDTHTHTCEQMHQPNLEPQKQVCGL